MKLEMLSLVFLMFLSAQQIYCCKKKKKVEVYGDNTAVLDVKLSTVLSTNRLVKLARIEMLQDDRAVRFEWSNGKKAEVKLQKEADECIYSGSLLEDEHSRVLVTGCLDEERSIQIQSQVYGDTLGVGKNGAVEDVRRKGHHQSDDAVDNDHDFLEQFPLDPSSSRKIPKFPAFLDLPLHVYLSPSWKSKFPQDEGVNQAKEILRHVQEMFHHPSLDTRFNLKYTDKDFFDTSAELQPTKSGIVSLSEYITEPQERSAIVYLSAGEIQAGRVGQAVRLSICDRDKKKPRSITLWDDFTIFTAQTVAHEIGHSLGYFHDFQTFPKILTGRTRTCGPGRTNGGPDNHLMDYGQPMESSWSNCTNEDFRNYYFRVTSEQPFCLTEPVSLDLPLKVYLAPSWRRKFPLGAGVNQAKKVLDYVKEMFHHPSLDTKINLKYADTDFVSTSAELQPTGSGLSRLSEYITEPQERSAIVYLSAGKVDGTLALSRLISICDQDKKKPRSINLWQESTLYTAQTVAQSIGHNIGFFHDFQDTNIWTGRNYACGPGKWNGGPNNQLMNYGQPMVKSWSRCSNEDFRNYYSAVTAEPGSTFCLSGPPGI